MIKKLTCCFTGHRPQRLPFREDTCHPAYIKLKETLKIEIEHLIVEEKVNWFITGMALGIDQICAELVLELKKIYPQIGLECAIPYEEQASSWTPQQREQYFRIIKNCDKESLLQTQYSCDCMKKRNQYMVDNSTFVLAVWDGSFRSGSGQTVRYAQKFGRDITVIHPATLEIIREKQTNI